MDTEREIRFFFGDGSLTAKMSDFQSSRLIRALADDSDDGALVVDLDYFAHKLDPKIVEALVSMASMRSSSPSASSATDLVWDLSLAQCKTLVELCDYLQDTDLLPRAIGVFAHKISTAGHPT